MEKKQIYINKNLKIYYYIQDEKAINDIEKAVWKGKKDIPGAFAGNRRSVGHF